MNYCGILDALQTGIAKAVQSGEIQSSRGDLDPGH